MKTFAFFSDGACEQVERCPAGFFGPNKEGVCLQSARMEKQCGEECASDECKRFGGTAEKQIQKQ